MRSDKALLFVVTVVLVAVGGVLSFVLRRDQSETLSPATVSASTEADAVSTPRRAPQPQHRHLDRTDAETQVVSKDPASPSKSLELAPAFLEGIFQGANPASVGLLYARLSHPMVRSQNYVVAMPTAPFDSEGRFRFDGLREDSRVRVSIFDRTDSSQALRESAIIHLKPGRNVVEIKALPGARLVIDLGGLALPREEMTAAIVPVRNLGMMPKELFIPYGTRQDQAYVRKIGEAQRVVVAGAKPGKYRLLVVPSGAASDPEVEVRTAEVLIDPRQRIPFWSGSTFTLGNGDSLRLSVGALDEPATVIARLASGIRFELRARDPKLSPEERGQLFRPFASGKATMKVVPGTYGYRFRYRLAGDEDEPEKLSNWQNLDLGPGERRELELTP